MIETASRHWPLLLSVGLLLLLVSSQVALSFKRNDGHFVYALDDPYIHMAIARNFAHYGVWGVTRYEFSSSTSSLLWTLLLAAIYSVTSSIYVPLVLNCIAAVAVVWIAYLLLQDIASGQVPKFILLLVLAFLLPMSPLILTGMEHTFHVVLCLLMVYIAATVIADDQFSFSKQSTKLLLLLTPLATMVRYESLFIVAVIASLLALRRRFLFATLIVLAAMVPLVVYGLISIKNGSFFLPNSLLLKGSLPQAGLLLFLKHAANRWLSSPHLLSLWLLGATLLFAQRKEVSLWQRYRVMLMIFMFATVLHVLFARVGWFYRYEAYLIAVGILVTGTLLLSYFSRLKNSTTNLLYRPTAIFSCVLAVTIAVVLLSRAYTAIGNTVLATQNIYQQQYQMATFLKRYYDGSAVAANDIGAINFAADIRCLDLYGLGSAEITGAKLYRQYNTRKIAELAQSHKVRIAVVYKNWFEAEGGVPREWTNVGEWITPNCVVCGWDIVTFYAVESDEIEALTRNLRDFSSSLPAEIVQTGRYIDTR